MSIHDKIYGCMLGAAIADAMGAPCETYTVEILKEKFGGFVYDYKVPFDDGLAHDQPVGMVTDDFSIAFVAGQHFAKAGGVTKQAAMDSVLEWGEMDKFFIPYSGPTTKASILKLRGEVVDTSRDYQINENNTQTNGAGMKAWMAGLFNPGNVDKAIDDAIVMCLPTHDNVIALAGGCAVAAAVAKALCYGSTVADVIDAGIYGAEEGLDRAWQIGRTSAGPNLAKKIKLAVEIGLKYGHDFEQCITEMTDIIGTGLNANEAIPAAFGFFAAAGGDVMQSVFLSINAGNDADTTGIMAAALAGALSGSKDIPEHHDPFLYEVNGFDIKGLSKQIADIVD